MGIWELRTFWGGGAHMYVRTDGRKEIHPCVLQDINPLGPLLKKEKIPHICESISHWSLQGCCRKTMSVGQGLTWRYPYYYNDDSRLLLLIIFRNDGTGFCCLRGFRTRKTIRKCSIAFLKEKSLTQPADSINDDHLCINKACDAKTHCSTKNQLILCSFPDTLH